MIPVPLDQFTPFLLKQAGLRASLLYRSFGFAIDDRDDLRQALALDCLNRLRDFDTSRGSWQGFVRGVVRNHAFALASRHIRRPELQPLDVDADCNDHAAVGPDAEFCAALELSLDVQRVVASLPEDLRTVARCLAEMPVYRVRQKTGLSQSQINRSIARIRAAFMAAGITRRSVSATRGVR